MIINVCWSSCPLFLSDFNGTSIIATDLLNVIPHFVKIHAEFLHAEGRTDRETDRRKDRQTGGQTRGQT